MKPWKKYCLIFSASYLAVALLIYLLSKSKASLLVIVLIAVPFNLIIFLRYRKHPERIPENCEIVRIRGPFQEICEKIKKLWR
ncbi:hypothetical protein KY346_00050 [Candidatus Woesearchaeota archaeon]|nr:hypothetical protein [Candidatus Woesearchaeota archaeon]